MKKVEKVSIANISFTLDRDAYYSLKQYLDSLHDYYDKDPDGSEIIADIEARIAELILGEQVYTKVVSKSLVDGIIAQLGTPQEIDDDAADDYAAPDGFPIRSLPRRLHRSNEGKIFGGVCSGMARFWDVNVAWIRLTFLLPTILFFISAPIHRWIMMNNFTGGWSWVFFVTYIVLWVALPMARTPRQKLEARGEKITPSAIRQSFQETANTPAAKKAASVAAEILAVIGRVVLFFVKFFVAVIGFSFLIAAFSMFIAMIVVLLNPLVVSGYAEISSALAGLTIVSPMVFVVLVLFCVMMPFAIIGIALLSLVFGWKGGKGIGRAFYISAIGVWLAAMVFCTVIIASNARFLHERSENGWGWSNGHGEWLIEEGEERDRTGEEYDLNDSIPGNHDNKDGRVEIRRID